MADNIKNNTLFTLKSSLYNPIGSKLKVHDFTVFCLYKQWTMGSIFWKEVSGIKSEKYKKIYTYRNRQYSSEITNFKTLINYKTQQKLIFRSGIILPRKLMSLD